MACEGGVEVGPLVASLAGLGTISAVSTQRIREAEWLCVPKNCRKCRCQAISRVVKEDVSQGRVKWSRAYYLKIAKIKPPFIYVVPRDRQDTAVKGGGLNHSDMDFNWKIRCSRLFMQLSISTSR